MLYPLLLHGRHSPAECLYEPLGPWLVPAHFGSPEAEYRILRQAAGLIDYSIYAVIEASGNDRLDFLHRILTNDIRRLKPGQGARSALLNANGKFLAELIVLALEDRALLLCEASRSAAILLELERFHFSEDVSLANCERSHAVLAIQGPRALETAQAFSAAVPASPAIGDHWLARGNLAPGNLEAARFVYLPLTRAPGLLCIAPADAAIPLWDTLQAGTTGPAPCGWQALNTARVEDGLAWFGVDADESNLLGETGLDDVLISETKGCYVGQEIVARMRTYGSANKKLVGLVLSGNTIPPVGAQLLRDGEEMGRVTSACFSPALRRAIALGYVKRPYYEPETKLDVLFPDQVEPAAVARLPFLSA